MARARLGVVSPTISTTKVAARALVAASWLATVAASGCAKKEAVPPAPVGNADTTCADSSGTVDTKHEMEPDVTCTGRKRELVCHGNWAAHCAPDDTLVALDNCRAHGEVCVPHACTNAASCKGCRACTPDVVRCGQDGAREQCRADGSGFDPIDSCDESSGLRCDEGSPMCVDLCAAAEAEHSYVGCDYFAVATSNSQLAFDGQDASGLCQPFTFAVVVANAQAVPATVTVQSPEGPPQTVTVAPSQATRIDLPCSPELKGDVMKDRFSVQLKNAAHHITSNVPIIVHQFNPIEFKSTDADGKTVYSYTADASLLIPTSSLTGNYMVVTQPTLLQELVPRDTTQETVQHSGPGFVAIVGVDETPTEVQIASSAYTLPSEDGSLPALSPGDQQTVTLARGEVLQLLSATPEDCDGKPSDNVPGGEITYCKVPKEYDLTGTQITTQGKVAVIAGHDCAFLPYNRWACDHLEETMFPLESWGKDVTVSLSETVACQAKLPNMARVLSSTDGNMISFTPSSVHAPVQLDKGQFVELEYSKDFRVRGSDAILVAQFLLGQDYNGRGTAGAYAKGDPSMSLAIPTEQYRSRYPFLTPETYTDNYVNVIARQNQLILLDGLLVNGFTTVASTQLTTARVRVGGGSHLIESAQPFGIVLYGYAPYTSYMLPGGLDLNPINHIL
ncbi:MAG: IgGFc-binding protein [Polyangiales bacterium]